MAAPRGGGGGGGRTGRPRNDPGPPAPLVPVTIAPRPQPPRSTARPVGREHGYAPEEVNILATPIAAVPLTYTTPDTITSTAPSINITVAYPASSLPSITAGGSRLSARGHYRITAENLRPGERILPMSFIAESPGVEEITHNVVLSKSYRASFASRKLVQLLGCSPRPIGQYEDKWYITPRGSIRCTESVVLWFRLPTLSSDLGLVRVLVLPEGHPDPGVSLIVGIPWINHEPMLQEYMRTHHVLPYVSPSPAQVSANYRDLAGTFHMLSHPQTVEIVDSSALVNGSRPINNSQT